MNQGWFVDKHILDTKYKVDGSFKLEYLLIQP
jgi:hypothetical protein